MKLMCPSCGNAIPAEDVNVATDVAVCTSCEGVFRASDLPTHLDLLEAVAPPDGSKIVVHADDSASGRFEIPWLGLRAIRPQVLLGVIMFTVLPIVLLRDPPPGDGVWDVLSFALTPLAMMLCMWILLINLIFERQTITVTHEGIEVRKLRPIISRHCTVTYESVESIAVRPLLARLSLLGLSELPDIIKWGMLQQHKQALLPTITHEGRPLRFAESVSRKEMDWLVGVLTSLVAKHRAGLTDDGAGDGSDARVLTCPHCGEPLAATSLDMETDEAMCASCGHTSKPSELVANAALRTAVASPPAETMIRLAGETGTGEAQIQIPRFRLTFRNLSEHGLGIFSGIAFGAGALFGCSMMCSGMLPEILSRPHPLTLASLLFMAPFLLFIGALGLYAWWGIFRLLTERQEITLGTDAVAVNRVRPLLSRNQSIRYDEVSAVEVRYEKPTGPVRGLRLICYSFRINAMASGLPLPTIAHGTKATYFAEYVTIEEMDWLVDVLRAAILRRTGKRV